MLASAATKTADGYKHRYMRPFLIWKATPDANVHRALKKDASSIGQNKYAVTVSENGWMNTDTFIEWTKELPKVPAGTRGLVVLDVFAAHRCEKSLSRLKDLNYDVVFIPGGCTSELQVHDVYVNRPFKAAVTAWHATKRAEQGSADGVSRTAISCQVARIYETQEMNTHVIRGMTKLIFQPINAVEEDQARAEKLQAELQFVMDCEDELANALGNFVTNDQVLEV
ncbi:Hypothetical protein, putative, partial [Bodo saltans]